ncbi:hypothetical protein HMPREF9134_00771 [Porphyromonas catoniae F0037]|uniref:Uncharacterized protein n=1 Tax=Porphyromonas catoniae F0037 TaxID=1127696 RepID=L1NEE3_9PORP|nr:hypothetical protein HMPREF9134_00771 [Porphyromonas catoniae F0037]
MLLYVEWRKDASDISFSMCLNSPTDNEHLGYTSTVCWGTNSHVYLEGAYYQVYAE